MWEELKALPLPEQRQRITAMHAATLSCSGDALAALNGGAAQ
ncbi:hypothetical protein QMF80_05810 [Streptomyces sp. G-G2]|nr:hypothetical protein [Streptomyces sp. G-G2]